MRTLGLVIVSSALACFAAESIQLPASFEAHPKWREMFPPGHAFYAEKTSAGGLAGMHGRDGGRLEGPSVTLHENGKPRTLGAYLDGARQGTFHVWSEDRKLILYTQYKAGKKHGITCLFQDGNPWFVQEWKAGELQNEAIVGHDAKAADNSEQLTEAREALASAEEAFKETEQDLRKSLHSWFTQTDQRIKEQNVKALKPVKEAQLAAAKQRRREEIANAIAGAHPSPRSRIGGAASAIAEDAGADRKAANKAAKARAKQANKALQERDTSIAKESKETYHFAMKSLEKSTGDSTGDEGQSERNQPKGKHKKGKRG